MLCGLLKTFASKCKKKKKVVFNFPSNGNVMYKRGIFVYTSLMKHSNILLYTVYCC